jgi:hypothetical protein
MTRPFQHRHVAKESYMFNGNALMNWSTLYNVKYSGGMKCEQANANPTPPGDGGYYPMAYQIDIGPFDCKGSSALDANIYLERK